MTFLRSTLLLVWKLFTFLQITYDLCLITHLCCIALPLPHHLYILYERTKHFFCSYLYCLLCSVKAQITIYLNNDTLCTSQNFHYKTFMIICVVFAAYASDSTFILSLVEAIVSSLKILTIDLSYK